MYFWNMAGALVRPNGITRYSNVPYLVLKCHFLFVSFLDLHLIERVFEVNFCKQLGYYKLI